MKSINRFKNIYFRKKISSTSGFTITELLVSSTISLLVLTAGFTLVRLTLDLNKSDETALKLSGKIDNALDFVVDEINSSKRVLTNISQQPGSCKKPPGEFVIGLSLPDQALDVSAYQKTNKNNSQFLRTQLNCPIIYTLVKNNNYSGKSGYSYKLMRRGPAINEKGYYVATKVNDTLVADRIRYSPKYPMSCSPGWTKRIIKGIITCTDKYRKSAEIGISAETTKNYDKYNLLSKTSGGFSQIQDGELIGSSSTFGGDGSACKDADDCDIFGTPIENKKITFFLDVSGSMACPRVWYCRRYIQDGDKYIQGMTRIEAAKKQLIKGINSLKTCTNDSDPNCVKFNVVAFSSYPKYLFTKGPKPLTLARKSSAIYWLNSTRANGGTSPWTGLNQAMQSQDVGQIILISDGEVSNQGRCFWNNKNMRYTDCYTQYNNDTRTNTATGKVNISTISIGSNFCNQHSKWLGELAVGNGGTCTPIK